MRRIVCTVALVVILFVTLPLSASAAKASGYFASLPLGHAYAAYTTPTVSTIVNSGVVFAPAGISCTEASTTSTNQVSNLSVGNVAASGAANTVVENTQTATNGQIQSTVTVRNVNILAGLVKATQLQATVASSASAAGASSTVRQESFSGLVINGTPNNSNPAPNTVKNLAGVGTVTLNEQSLSKSAKSTAGLVNMIDIRVTVANNRFGLPANAQIVIGHVDSSENIEPQPVTAQAGSYGLYAGTGSQVVVSPLAPAYTGCAGGSAQNSLASKNTATIGSVTGITDTANANIAASGSTASGQSAVTGLNLLGGLVKADKVITKANTFFNGTESGSASVTLMNATIAGIVQSQSPAPDTVVTLPGFGYVVLNEQARSFSTSGAIQGVYAMDIHVTAPANIFGLAVGTRIIVGSAYANVSVY